MLKLHAHDGHSLVHVPMLRASVCGIEAKCQLKRSQEIAYPWSLCLGPEIRRTSAGWELRARPSMVETFLKDLDLSDCRPVNTSFPTAAEQTANAVPVNLDPPDIFHRSAVGRLLWMCPVRPDIVFLVEEACRRMANPSTYDYACLERILLYVAGLAQRLWLSDLSGSSPTWLSKCQMPHGRHPMMAATQPWHGQGSQVCSSRRGAGRKVL